MIFAFDYASPSVFESDRERALLGMSANARRPVRFHGRVTRNIPLFRFTLRALGEAIWSNDTWVIAGRIHELDPRPGHHRSSRTEYSSRRSARTRVSTRW